VLAKLTVASVVMPLFAIAAAIVSEVVVCALASTKLASLGIPGLLGALWSPSVWGASFLLHAYVFSAAALWFLPVVAWALFVSSWAPRSPVMLATLIPLGIALAEFIALRSHYALEWMGSRVETTAFYLHAFRAGKGGAQGLGVVIDADTFQVPHSLIDMISPLDFVSSPALWSGILVATALVASAIWIRRYRAASA
jgi:ABC-2 type transport system permease protein